MQPRSFASECNVTKLARLTDRLAGMALALITAGCLVSNPERMD
jgi:hypothetical protein